MPRISIRKKLIASEAVGTMKRSSRSVFGILIGILFLAIGCSLLQDQTIGERNRVTVVADFEVWRSIAETMERSFGKEIFTPQPEKIYYLEPSEFEKLGDVSRRPYIIIIAPLKSEAPTSAFLNKSLSPQAADGVNRGEYYVFSKPNLWARNQLVLFVAAPDLESLMTTVNQHVVDLFALIDQHHNEVVRNEMYARLEQKDLEDRLHDKYGWRLRIQHDYVVITDDSLHQLVQLRRTYPDRWLTIQWINGPDQYRNEAAAITLRDSLGKWFKDPVFNYPEYFRYNELEFLGRPGGLLTGLWATTAAIGGGPFFTYVFYDSLLQRTFLLDGAVFNPRDEKEPLLRQLQIMAQTFVPGKKR
jgi:hypothetical protein